MKYLIYISQICIAVICFKSQAQFTVKKDTVLMGCTFDITIVADDSLTARKNINLAIDEIIRIENLISEWKSSSQVSEINRNAGIRAVKVDKELFNLTKRALQFSEITDGAFDISIVAMDKIWKFDGSMDTLPTLELISKAISKVGYKNIELNETDSSIFLKLPGMKIGFGATGKGYAADRGRQLMQQLNVKAGIVNASGDMAVWETQSNKKPWRIGIVNPLNTRKSLDIIEATQAGITTSGNYQNYVELNGKRYSHIINPKTGIPTSELISVTVIGPNAETANGFSTSIMVLGQQKGFELLNDYPEYACLILTHKGKIKKSKNYKSVLKSINQKNFENVKLLYR